MTLQARFVKKVFRFNFEARTSRGRMRERASWFLKIWNAQHPDIVGIGECGPLPGLSVDDRPDFEQVLKGVEEALTNRKKTGWDDIPSIVPRGYPSIVFGLETALLDLQNGGTRKIFDNSFLKGTGIPINGLVWMGDLDQMLQQTSIKIHDGYRCLKIKVGGLNFEKECDILNYIRRKYFKDDITLRLDANGSFKLDEALYKLNDLARFNIHSIEQPVKPGSPVMEELCQKSPIPIALDEELIGVEQIDEKKKLLSKLKPRYIILKPTLHGGLRSCEEWIKLAEAAGIGWWITSALESNVGLNAISQFAANYPIVIPQGLGTGQLFEDNFPSPLEVKKGELFFNPSLPWELVDL